MINDFGVIFTQSLDFKEHINVTLAECFSSLGFAKRCASYFTALQSNQFLFDWLVGNKLENASVIWSPSSGTVSNKIEKTAKKFSRDFFFF